MNIVAAKLIEVVARALFTIGATYLLPLKEAGQFGLAATLIGLFAFAFGWERHIDIQRRLAGTAPTAIDYAVAHLPRFWGFNYTAMAPILLVLLLTMARLELLGALLVIAITVFEQQGNTAYNLAVIERRYRIFVWAVAIRSAALLLVSAGIFLFAHEEFMLRTLLLVWASVGALSIAAFLIISRRVLTPAQQRRLPAGLTFHTGIFAQHRASMTHFLIGGLAVLMIQVDRLVVGAILPIETVGLYFRHVVVVSFVYQFFNVAFYNRRLGEIFARAREGGLAGAYSIIHREFAILVTLCLLGLSAGFAIDWASSERWTKALSLDKVTLSLLLASAILRVYADFLSLILNAQFREKRLLSNQLAAFALGVLVMLLLTWQFGLRGAAAGTIAGSSLYLFFNKISLLGGAVRVAND